MNTNSSRSKNPETHLPGDSSPATIICGNNDATQYILINFTWRYKFMNS